MFQLTAQEWANLKSQFSIENVEVAHGEVVVKNWSQFVTSSKRHRGAAYRPAAFTERALIHTTGDSIKLRSCQQLRNKKTHLHARLSCKKKSQRQLWLDSDEAKTPSLRRSEGQ
jgi:hypothetical protein